MSYLAPDTTSPLIVVENLAYQAAGLDILRLAKWKVERGDHCLVLGVSGSGKTTLLHVLAGLLRPTMGAVRIAGENICEYPEYKRDRFRGRHIGIIFQTFHLVGALNVLDNLKLAQSVAGSTPDEKRLLLLLEQVGVSHRARAMPEQLSHGERQRVAVARAVVNEPVLILADEPTSALDDAHCESTIKLLFEHAGAHEATLIIATHDQRLKDFVPRKVVIERPGGTV